MIEMTRSVRKMLDTYVGSISFMSLFLIFITSSSMYQKPVVVRPLHLRSNSGVFLKWYNKRLVSPDGQFGFVASAGHCAGMCIKSDDCGSFAYNAYTSHCIWRIEPLYFQEIATDKPGWTTFTRKKGNVISFIMTRAHCYRQH